MSQPLSDTSSQIMQRPSPSKMFPQGDGNSDISRNANGKRSRLYLQEDQLESPRKLARLSIDQHSEQNWCRQLSNPIANDSSPSREQDFTTGPGHIVFVDEQGKRCPAICFNKGLLNIFNQISEFSREVREGDKALQHTQREIERIKSSNRSAGLEEAKRAVEEAIKNQENIEVGIPELKEAQRQYKSLTEENTWSKLKLDNTRAVFQILIEQILNRENLLNIPPSKPQEPAKDTKAPSQGQTPVLENKVGTAPKSNGSETGPASSSPTRPQSPTNEEEEQITPRQLALRTLRFAAEELTYYKEELAYMQDEYPQAIAAEQTHRRDQQHPNNTPASTTQTDIDLITLQKTQHATRQVTEAEEAYDRAELHAQHLGLGDILADPHACFYGEIYNEFQPEHTEEEKVAVMAPIHRSRIEAWLASVPVPDTNPFVDCRTIVEDAEGGVEVDDWDLRSVEMWDSVSLVARDVLRTKIDKWRLVER